MQPPPGRLPTQLLVEPFQVEVFQNARALFHDNVVFFRIDSIRSPGPGSGFLFRLPHRLAKAQCKDYASAGIVVDADAAVLCLHDFCHGPNSIGLHPGHDGSNDAQDREIISRKLIVAGSDAPICKYFENRAML
jgi:hypothetical protein